MTRITTLLLVFLLALGAKAQITIGQNEMPHSDDDLYRTQANLNLFLNYSATGANHSWNFASLTAAGQDEAAYQSVSSTNVIYALVYADIFFNSNRANHAKSGVDIAFSDLLPIDNPYSFYYRSSSTYEKVGYGAELSSIPLPIIFNQHDVVYELPVHYGDNTVSASSWQVSIPTLAYYGYKQVRHNEVDGWGSITTPSGTFNALRVKTTIEAHDSINVDTLNVGFNIDRPITREYKWLANNIRVPVLQVNTTELFGTEVITAIYFYDQPHTITVNPPLAQVLCPGSPIAVNYTRTGLYNSASLFVQANVFRAQLSDASGDFTNAVNIGSLTSTASGVINATIPANTPVGTHYRIRVISTSPAFTGDDNGVDLSIGAPPVALVSAAGATSFCAGGSVELDAQAAAGQSYQWSMNGDAIADATSATYEVQDAGNYTMRVTNACGSALSPAMNVVVNALPAHTLEQSAALACNGAAVTISSTNTSGQTVLTYQWSLNGDAITDATNADLETAQAGSYSLEITNSTTGCTFTTAAVSLATDVAATPIVSADGLTVFCEGGSVTLDASGDEDANYQWYMDGDAITDATASSLTVSTPGSYTVIATTVLGCVSAASNATDVLVKEAPVAPTVSASEATSFCEGGSVTLTASSEDDVTYQWSNGNDVLADATDSVLTVMTSGSYSVVVTSGGGCSSAPGASIDVTVNPLPAVPEILQDGSTLTASGTGNFQWYFNGDAIEGATDATVELGAFGDYTVMVTDANGCGSTSDAFNYLSTTIAERSANTFSVSPNPTTGAFNVQLPGAVRGTDRYTVLDATGNVVMAGTLSGPSTKLDLAGSSAGMYFVRVVKNGTTSVARIVLN